MMIEDDEEKNRKFENMKIPKVVGDGLGTLVGVPMAPKNSIRPKITICFDHKKKFGNSTVWVPIDSY